MANNDLLQWTTSDVDFYELLGLTSETFSESELRRAYRKTSLKYHPDKLGKDYNATKFELFQAAHGVLKDPELKNKYDNNRNARLLKQRAHELFEGKRRQMKEDLEARERGAIPTNGTKRPREEDQSTMQDFKRFAEEGRKKRAARASMMATSSPAPAPRDKTPIPPSAEKPPEPEPEEDEIERLERRIREAEAAKAKRRAERKQERVVVVDQDTATPTKRPDVLDGLKADDKSSASPRFSFSPAGTPKTNKFAATMARLKAAEKQRLEEEIRKQEAAETAE
ncbi:hypothetical protein B0O99DRAFT_610638 [Bisporella sp. PMI_857]|nr:hypothetical protein B0O99DRAFT_612569 [Bisporella sp. PMI_857]KAH8600409.1 hypothetical protein B0O99DRAFT_610638 [Bisporella sp. PMI_857]